MVLKPGVRDALLKIGREWVLYAKIPQDAILDYTLVGGSAGYNYTPISDLDLHIIIDPHKMPIQDRELQHLYIMRTKNTWATSHNITVAGMPVEIYAQPNDEKNPIGQGVYSLFKNAWIHIPEHKNIKYSYQELKDLVHSYIEAVNAAIETGNLKAAKEIKDTIVQGRGEGLLNSEFDVRASAFKAIRNTGILARLSDFINSKEDSLLSYGRRG